MVTSVSLQDQTKEQLDNIVAAEGHTSQDSAIKSLIQYRQLYLQTQPDTTPTSPTNHPSKTHAAYLGGVGSGKTVTEKYHIHHTLNNTEGNDVIVIDPIECYTAFTHQHNGALTPGTEHAHLAHTDQFNTTAVTAREWARTVTLPYILESAGAYSTRTFSLEPDVIEDILTHADTHSEHTRYTTSDIITGIADNSHLRSLLSDINNALEDPSFPELQHPTDTDVPTESLVTIQPDTGDVPTAVEVLNATLQAFHIGATRESDVEIHIDQAHYLLSTVHGYDILTSLLEQGPKHGVYINITTQAIDDVRQSTGVALEMFNLFETVYLHRIGEVTEEQRTALALTSAEAAYVEHAQVGDRDKPDTQIMVRSGGKWRQRTIHIPDGLQMLLD